MATASETRPRPSPGILLEGVSWADYEAQLEIIGNRHIRVNYDSGRMEIYSPARLRSIPEKSMAAYLASPSIVLEGVTWADYEAQLRIIGNRRIRVNYDSGRMEIMSPLRRHGNRGSLLGIMVHELVVGLGIPSKSADPVTLKRFDLEKGVEPDKLFHFRANAIAVQERREFDFTVDPPPDLVIEVDVTSNSVPRLPIYAALGTPEIWRFDDDEELQFLHIQLDGTYQARDRSRAFPALTVAEAARFLEEGQAADETAWILTFRAYIRDVLLPQHLARPDDDR
jgi:Uma2 family endonuclease